MQRTADVEPGQIPPEQPLISASHGPTGAHFAQRSCQFDELQVRLCQMERSLMWCRRALICGAAVACGILGIAATTGRGNVVEAEAFVITDASGKLRGVFGLAGDEPGMVLTDAQGRKRLRFRIEDSGPTISLYDAKQSIRLQLAATDEGPETTFFSPDQQPRLRLRGSANEPQICVCDAKGAPRAKFFVLDGDDDRGSGLSISDAEGQLKLLFAQVQGGISVIRAGEEFLAPAAAAKPAAQRK